MRETFPVKLVTRGPHAVTESEERLRGEAGSSIHAEAQNHRKNLFRLFSFWNTCNALTGNILEKVTLFAVVLFDPYSPSPPSPQLWQPEPVF
jgi:hypothetical protein